MPVSLPPSYVSLQRKIDDWFVRASGMHLGQIPCQAGCSDCCIGTFAITLLDVRSLQEGLTRLPAAHRKRVERRALDQKAAITSAYPKLAGSPYLDAWTDAEIDHLVSQFSDLPCPALEADGVCGVYEFRPLVCRSMGLPTEQDGQISGACGVQTFVPITRLPASFRTEEEEMARREAAALEQERHVSHAAGDEVLLQDGFLPVRESKDLS